MTTINAAEIPITDTFRDVQGLIYKIARKYSAADFDDLISAGGQVFWDAYRTWKRADDLPTFPCYFAMCCHRRFAQIARRAHARKTTADCRTVAIGKHQIPARGTLSFDLAALCAIVSEDAAEVLSLVLDTPPEIAKAAIAKGGQDCNIRTSLREYLRDIGWTGRRISESFAEIVEAL